MDNIIKGLPWNKKLEILRAVKGWTQVEAAKRCNTHQKLYWSWEKGKTHPSKKSQAAIASAYDVEVEDIFQV
ncbi:helix-turn-helix transcriptional regulator [Clostridium brassicae]|uniref:Helix-turn-helix transcriptional regulator n=1 Tax=Clostridium brassicae TaxID=2999072 RepID=A0ABT4DB90_9CLOT|nr:helix-turn-helix transcriptional regulator [Clostridium brassicae]MCY6958411.1 helix-turn-helix transcriptional regulator [Clostridium brassicae]